MRDRHRNQHLVLGGIGLGGRFSVSLREALGAALGQDPRRTLYLVFRSVPLMVLLVFVYNLPQLFPVTQPLLGVPFIAGLVSMTVTEAAYMAEIHRGGLLSVAKGQSEAGHALSFSFIGIQRLIVIPQAFRISLPTLINEYITIIKLSSILSVVSLPELLLTGQRLYAQNFLVMETLLAVAVYYVMVVTVFTGCSGRWKIVSIFSVSVRKPSARRNARRCARACRR